MLSWMPSSFWLICASAAATATAVGSKARPGATRSNFAQAGEPSSRVAELEKSPSFACLSVAPAGSFTRYSCSPALESDESPTPSEVISPNGSLTASGRESLTLSGSTGARLRLARLLARARLRSSGLSSGCPSRLTSQFVWLWVSIGSSSIYAGHQMRVSGSRERVSASALS